jgi:hypothetical protein
MPSQFVIPEPILIGNPVCKLLKSWIPDKDIRDDNENLRVHHYFNIWIMAMSGFDVKQDESFKKASASY